MSCSFFFWGGVSIYHVYIYIYYIYFKKKQTHAPKKDKSPIVEKLWFYKKAATPKTKHKFFGLLEKDLSKMQFLMAYDLRHVQDSVQWNDIHGELGRFDFRNWPPRGFSHVLSILCQSCCGLPRAGDAKHPSNGRHGNRKAYGQRSILSLVSNEIAINH